MPSEGSLLNLAMMGKLFWGLILVLGILGMLVFLLKFLQRKKMMFSGFENDLKVLQTTHLSSKQKLVVIHWNEAHYLIALTVEGGFLVDKKPVESVPVKGAKKTGAVL